MIRELLIEEENEAEESEIQANFRHQTNLENLGISIN